MEWLHRLVRPYIELYGIPRGKRELFNIRLNNDIV
nr:MAG TPA: hypothetical protein [Caudoviricetes sp.]